MRICNGKIYITRKRDAEKSKVCFNVTKHTSDDIINNFDTINSAITIGKCVSFYYFDYDERSKRVY